MLYLVHGGGDTDVSWPGVGAAGLIMDNLMAEGKMVPMVVVMPNGSIEMPDGNMMGEVPVFAEDMVKSIIPFIEDNYRVHTDQANRAMAGLSIRNTSLTKHYAPQKAMVIFISPWLFQ